MFSHVTLGTDDIEGARRFYDATLGALGIEPGRTDERGRLRYVQGGRLLLVTRPIDGGEASGGNGGTIGFLAATPEAVDAWHAAGVAIGGTAIEDAPGIREGGSGRLYLAYLRDPSGNKLCAMHRMT